jgi:hydroxymethylglutaryl-CoA synthase
MPETGWAISYLFALGHEESADHGELASYCQQAGVDPQAVLEEMRATPRVAELADPERLQYEAYPLTMAVLRASRASDNYRREILDKLALGSETMRDLGNLYTAALPAWMAAGFEQAAAEDRLSAGEEVLTLGYGSGDAAEVIPFFMADGWREATAAIRFGDAMEQAVDITFDQYEALHAGRRAAGLEYLPANEFVIDHVGQTEDRHFSDLGIEYYRYVG